MRYAWLGVEPLPGGLLDPALPDPVEGGGQLWQGRLLHRYLPLHWLVLNIYIYVHYTTHTGCPLIQIIFDSYHV